MYYTISVFFYRCKKNFSALPVGLVLISSMSGYAVNISALSEKR